MKRDFRTLQITYFSIPLFVLFSDVTLIHTVH